MDSAERRRLNRLLRKPTPNLSRTGGSSKQRLPHRGSHKQARSGHGSSAVEDTDDTKQHEISINVAKLCADMCGVSNLSGLAEALLQKHLNQVARLLIHSILRVMEQNRRGVPQASDVDLASVLVGLEAPFGTAPASYLPIRTGGRTATSGSGGKVFFIRPDKEIDVKALLLREPAGVVYDVSLVAHWLSVNGKQPISPQNPPPDFLARMSLLNGLMGGELTYDRGTNQITQTAATRFSSGDDADKGRLTTTLTGVGRLHPGTETTVQSLLHPRTVSSLSIDRRPHEVSQEVMIYFRELTEACVGASENRRHEALDNATLDPGLQPILPHLVTFITEGVRVNVTNHNLAILIYLMRLVKALVDNPHISLEPYLHMLVPTVATCILNRQLCAKPITDNHWALRDFAAKQLVTLCNRHNTSTNELYTRVTRELARALHSWIDGIQSEDGSSEFKVPDPVRLKPDPLCTSTTTVEVHKCSDVLLKGGPSLGTALRSMNTLYGILVALAEFGAQTLRTLVFPVMPSLCRRLSVLVEPIQPPLTQSATDSVDPSVHFAPPPPPSPQRLSPADQRSFEFLKVMMTNRIAPLLADWRTRQNLGTTLDDYRVAYECMATCLHNANRSVTGGNPTALVTTTTLLPQRSALSTGSVNTTESTPTRLSLVTNSTVTLASTVKSEDSRVPITSTIVVDRPIHLVPISR